MIPELTVKQILCIKLVKYSDKYTEMHGQQNFKKTKIIVGINVAKKRVSPSRPSILLTLLHAQSH